MSSYVIAGEGMGQQESGSDSGPSSKLGISHPTLSAKNAEKDEGPFCLAEAMKGWAQPPADTPAIQAPPFAKTARSGAPKANFH